MTKRKQSVPDSGFNYKGATPRVLKQWKEDFEALVSDVPQEHRYIVRVSYNRRPMGGYIVVSVSPAKAKATLRSAIIQQIQDSRVSKLVDQKAHTLSPVWQERLDINRLVFESTEKEEELT